jgi:hypothetical protein
MKTEIIFRLERPAKSKGADRYEAEKLADFKIYVPQEISRESGSKPVDKITITFDTE